MQQLFLLGREKLEWREVGAPRLEGPLEALVRPFAVAKCDLDHAMLANRMELKLRMGRALRIVDPDFERCFGGLFNTPLPFGHECVAEVVDIGEKVVEVQVGDVVSVPFQISCGTCIHCREHHTSICSSVPPGAVYGFGRHKQFGGAMCDLLKVPFADGMLLNLRKDADFVHLASLGDNVADAYRHIGPALEQNKNRSILVVSGDARSIATYTVLIARAMGARHIAFVDSREAQRKLALHVGADTAVGSCKELRDSYDIVVDCCAPKEELVASIDRIKPFGTLSSTGWHFRKTLLPLMRMHSIGITFKIGLCNARDGASRVAKLIQDGNLSLAPATTKIDNWDNAINAFLGDSTKIIVQRARLEPSPGQISPALLV